MKKPLPIKERIRAAYRSGISYHELLDAVFPRDQYPNAWGGAAKGGPPGCAMAFGKALREMGAWTCKKEIILPPEPGDKLPKAP